jgi:hypothetical protein
MLTYLEDGIRSYNEEGDGEGDIGEQERSDHDLAEPFQLLKSIDCSRKHCHNEIYDCPGGVVQHGQ